MKTTVVAVLLWLFVTASAVVCGELDTAYREQYDQSQKRIAVLKTDLERNKQSLTQLQTLYDSTNDYVARRDILDGMKIPAKRIKDIEPQLQQMNDKLADLKLRILERTDKLPPWWSEQ